MGAHLTTVDQHHLTSIAACLWVKNEMRSRIFSNEQGANAVLSKPVTHWSLVVTLVGTKIPVTITLNDDGHFTVSLPFFSLCFLPQFSECHTHLTSSHEIETIFTAVVVMAVNYESFAFLFKDVHGNTSKNTTTPNGGLMFERVRFALDCGLFELIFNKELVNFISEVTFKSISIRQFSF